MNATSDKPTATPKEVSFAMEPELYESLSAAAAERGKSLETVAEEILKESLLRKEEMERRRRALLELVAESESLGLYD